MAFFTRVNTNVPFLPSDECHSLDDNNISLKKDSEEAEQCTNDNERNNNVSSVVSENETATTAAARYEYVVDRVLGVEV